MRRKAFTLIELLVVVAIIALLISILLPSLARARELSKRAVCAANLKGIGTACATYANDNDQSYPIAAAPAAPAASGSPPVQTGLTTVAFTGQIGFNRGFVSNVTSTAVSTTRSFWMLVRDGATAPKQFICPSTDGVANSDDNPNNYYDFGTGGMSGTTPVANSPTPTTGDFWKQISYGIQVPFGQVGKPTSERETRMALGADKGWVSALKDGALSGPSTTIGANSASSPDDWRQWNSPNHGGLMEGEGQNVLFADFHVEFDKRPLSGVGLDNIYTHWVNASAPNPDDRAKGGYLDDKFAPYGDTDTVIYP